MKSPAFQFYPADFLADENVELMNNEETGCYIRLLSRCWLEGSIPAEISKIAKLCREDSEKMAQLWFAISGCFVPVKGKPDRLTNPRLEVERKRQEEYRVQRVRAGKNGAKSRWDKGQTEMASAIAPSSSRHNEKDAPAIVPPMAKHSSSSSSSSSCITYVSSKNDDENPFSDIEETKQPKPFSKESQEIVALFDSLLKENGAPGVDWGVARRLAVNSLKGSKGNAGIPFEEVKSAIEWGFADKYWRTMFVSSGLTALRTVWAKWREGGVTQTNRPREREFYPINELRFD